MNFKKFKKILSILLPLLTFTLMLGVLFSCANDYKRRPTGGEKDKIAPEVLEFYPVLGSLNQDKDTEVRIEFNEYIDFNSTKKAISISPLSAADKSEISWGEKDVVISFSELEDDETVLVIVNTTLKDLRQNNIADNFIVNFSTGSYLDSAGISGKIGCSIIEDKINIINEKNLKVLLFDYDELKDSTSWSKNLRAKYEIGVNKDLEFNLNHIKDGNYLPLILKDKNGSGKLDINNADGIYTFGNEIVRLNRNEKKKYYYYLGKQDTIRPYITDIRSLNIDLIEVEFSEKVLFSLDSKVAASLKSEFDYNNSTNETKNYLIDENYKLNSDKFLYLTTDSLVKNSNLNLSTNIFQDIYLNKVNENLISKDVILPDSINSNELKLLDVLPSKIKKDEKISLKFNKIKPESIYIKLIEKKIEKNVIDLTDKIKYESFISSLDFEKIELVSSGKYKILVERGVSDTLYYKDFNITKEKIGYGSISGDLKINLVENFDESSIVILFNQLDNDKKVYRLDNTSFNGKYKLKVRPGKYLVASFIDEDRNGLYSVGKYWGMDNFFSEKVAQVNDTIVVRKNWESSGFDLNFLQK